MGNSITSWLPCCLSLLLVILTIGELAQCRSIHFQSPSDRWFTPCSIQASQPHIVNETIQSTLHHLLRSTSVLKDILLDTKAKIKSTYFQQKLFNHVEAITKVMFNFTDTPKSVQELTETTYSDHLQTHFRSLYFYLEHVEHICKDGQSLKDQLLCAPDGLIDDVMTSLHNILCHVKIGLKGLGVNVSVMPRVGLSSEFVKHDRNYTHEVVRLYKLMDDGSEFMGNLKHVYSTLCEKSNCNPNKASASG